MEFSFGIVDDVFGWLLLGVCLALRCGLAVVVSVLVVDDHVNTLLR